MTSVLGSQTSESPEQKIKRKLERIDSKIKGKIIPSDSRDHRQYKDSLGKNPIAMIVIPNYLYYDWDAKISLQAALGCRLSTYAELLNFSLSNTGMFSSVGSSIEARLKREASKIKRKYSSLRGAKKTAFKQFGRHKLMLFEREVCFQSRHVEIPGE